MRVPQRVLAIRAQAELFSVAFDSPEAVLVVHYQICDAADVIAKCPDFTRQIPDIIGEQLRSFGKSASAAHKAVFYGLEWPRDQYSRLPFPAWQERSSRHKQQTHRSAKEGIGTQGCQCPLGQGGQADCENERRGRSAVQNQAKEEEIRPYRLSHSFT